MGCERDTGGDVGEMCHASKQPWPRLRVRLPCRPVQSSFPQSQAQGARPRRRENECGLSLARGLSLDTLYHVFWQHMTRSNVYAVYISTRDPYLHPSTNGSYLPFSIIDTSLHLHPFLPLFFGIARDTSHPPHAVIAVETSILTAKLSRPASVNSRRPHKPSS